MLVIQHRLHRRLQKAQHQFRQSGKQLGQLWELDRVMRKLLEAFEGCREGVREVGRIKILEYAIEGIFCYHVGGIARK